MNDPLYGFENNPDISSKIDQSMISNASIPGYTERMLENQNAMNAPEAIGPQGASAYPGMGHNINVGSVGGSRIGSQPIFVPGGNVLAVDPILSRRKALDDAARKRAQALTPYQAPANYQLKGEGARLQQTFDNQYLAEMDRIQAQAYEDYGIDAPVVLKDKNTEYGKRMALLANSYQNYGKNIDLITGKVAAMDKALTEKSAVYDPEVLKLREEYKSLTGDLFGDEFKPEALAKVNDLYARLEGHMTLQNFLNDEVKWKDLEGKVSSSYSVNDKGEYYKTSSNQKTSFAEVRKAVYQEVIDNFQGAIDSGIYTEQQIKDAVDARLQDKQILSSTSVVQKREDAIDRSKIDEPIIFSPTNPQTAKITKYNQDGTASNGEPTEYNELFYAPVTGARKVVLDSPKRVNGNDMNDVVSGNVDFTPAGFAVIKDKNGKDAKVVYGKAIVRTEVYVSADGNTVLSKAQYKSAKDDNGNGVKTPGTIYKSDFKKQTVNQEQDMTVVWDEAIQGKMKQSVNAKAVSDLYTKAEKAKMDARGTGTNTTPKSTTPKAETSNIPTVTTKEDFDKLNKGDKYIDSEDGLTYIK